MLQVHAQVLRLQECTVSSFMWHAIYLGRQVNTATGQSKVRPSQPHSNHTQAHTHRQAHAYTDTHVSRAEHGVWPTENELAKERWAVFTLNSSDTKYVGVFLHQPILQLSRQQLSILHFNSGTNCQKLVQTPQVSSVPKDCPHFTRWSQVPGCTYTSDWPAVSQVFPWPPSSVSTIC